MCVLWLMSYCSDSQPKLSIFPSIVLFSQKCAWHLSVSTLRNSDTNNISDNNDDADADNRIGVQFTAVQKRLPKRRK